MVTRILAALLISASASFGAAKLFDDVHITNSLQVDGPTTFTLGNDLVSMSGSGSGRVLDINTSFAGVLASPLLAIDSPLTATGTVFGITRDGSPVFSINTAGTITLGNGSGLTGITTNQITGNIASGSISMTSGTLLGRYDPGFGAIQNVTIGTGLQLSGGAISVIPAVNATSPYFITNQATGGTNLLPAFTRDTNLNTGMYFSGLNEVAFTAAGVRKLRLSTIDADFTIPIELPDGTAALPTLRSDTVPTTGISFPANTVVSSISGTARATVSASGLTLAPAGTLTADNVSATNVTVGTVVRGITNLNLSTQSNGNINLAPNGTGKVLMNSKADDGNGTFQLASSVSPSGGFGFGADTNLYRSAADTLRTDDSFSVGGTATIAGNTTMNGTDNTAPNHSRFAASGSTVMTRDQVDWERMILGFRFRDLELSASTVTTQGAGSVSTLANGAIQFTTNNNTNRSARAVVCDSITNAASTTTVNYSRRIGVAMSADLSLSTNMAVRVLVGVSAVNPAGSNVNAITARGFGVELTGNAGSISAIIFAHNGTTYTATAPVLLGASVGLTNLILESDGAGNISLFASHGTPAIRPSSTAVATTAGGPTGVGVAASNLLTVAQMTSAAVAPAGTNVSRIYNVTLSVE